MKKLLSSLEEHERLEIDHAWAAEAERRLREFRAGRMKSYAICLETHPPAAPAAALMRF